MRREIVTHLLATILLFFAISLFHKWFSVDYIAFWAGGILGTLLPDIDHIIYIYFLSPIELTSQRATKLISMGDYWRGMELLSDTRTERTKLIFHTAHFQVLFLVLSFLVVTSSGSLFGTGLVISFCLHLLVDQIVDLARIKDLGQNWFAEIEKVFGKLDTIQVRVYLTLVGFGILLLSLWA